MSEVIALPKKGDAHLYWDGQPFDANRVRDRIHACASAVLENIIQIGRDLIWAKRCLPYGDFMHWLDRDVGMSHRRASEFMRIAERITHSQSPHTRAFLSQAAGESKHKMLALLDISDEEMAEAMDEGAFLSRPLDEVDAMSVRDLRDALRKMRAEKGRAEVDRHKAERRADRAEKKLSRADASNLTDTSEMPHRPLLQAIEALSRVENAIADWIEDANLSDDWLMDGGIAADPTAKGLVTSLQQKAMNIRSLLSPPPGMEGY